MRAAGKRAAPFFFLKMRGLPLQGKVPMHRLLYQENKRKKRTGALERIRYETYYMWETECGSIDCCRTRNQNEKGRIHGKRRFSFVSWCIGHLAELSQPSCYGSKYEKWSLEALPILPETWQLTISKDKEKQFSVLRDLLFRNYVTIKEDILQAPEQYTAWFKIIFEKFYHYLTR